MGSWHQASLSFPSQSSSINIISLLLQALHFIDLQIVSEKKRVHTQIFNILTLIFLLCGLKCALPCSNHLLVICLLEPMTCLRIQSCSKRLGHFVSVLWCLVHLLLACSPLYAPLLCYTAWAGAFLCRWGQPSCKKHTIQSPNYHFSIKNMLSNTVFIKIEVWINLPFSAIILEKFIICSSLTLNTTAILNYFHWIFTFRNLWLHCDFCSWLNKFLRWYYYFKYKIHMLPRHKRTLVWLLRF